MTINNNLQKRVQQFNRMELPGQPMGMHMGTCYLVNDLWRECQRLREALESVLNHAIDEYYQENDEDGVLYKAQQVVEEGRDE